MSRVISVTAQVNGERADVLISRESGLTRSAAARLIADGAVTLNGIAIKKNYRVTEGESFFVTLPDVVDPVPVAENIALAIVYEDADVVVVNKARGMVVHPAPGHSSETLVNALLHHCGDSLSGIGGERRPGIVHRLDKDTSGLIIAAKNDAAHLSLSKQLSNRSLSRIYEALVHGRFRKTEGSVDAPIGRHPTDRKRMAVTDKSSRAAVTRYEVLTQYQDYAHIRCTLETGRTHQIRVHMEHIGHPLLGDLQYGRKKPEMGISGQCLHARSLRFIHPTNGEHIALEAPLPEYFTDILNKLR